MAEILIALIHIFILMNIIPTNLIDLLEDDTEFSIIMALYSFKSLNLKQFSKFLDIPESTLLRKIKILIKYQVIELDQETTLSHRGKFYALKPKIQFILDQNPHDHKSRPATKDDIKTKIQKKKHLFVALSSINLQFAKILSQYIQIDPEIMTNKEKRGAISSQLSILHFQSQEEIIEFKEILGDFQKKIDKFEKNKMGNPKFNYSFHYFACPVGLLTSQNSIDKLFS